MVHEEVVFIDVTSLVYMKLYNYNFQCSKELDGTVLLVKDEDKHNEVYYNSADYQRNTHVTTQCCRQSLFYINSLIC